MSCNCKNIEKLKKTQIFATKNDKIGVINRLNSIFFTFLIKSFILALLVILTPIVILVLIFTFLFNGKLVFPLPKKFSKFLKRLKENE